MQETDADTKGASRAGRGIRPPVRTTVFVGVSLVLVAAAAAGFSAGTIEDGTRRIMIDDPNGGQFLWPS